MEETLASSSTTSTPTPPPPPLSQSLSASLLSSEPDPLWNSSTSQSLAPTPTRSPAPPLSVTRLWRPAAQRNLRNQWSNLSSHRQKWASLSSTARSHATSLVNAHLSQRYMDGMDLGVLSDMPDIRKKACWKLFKEQELHQSKLLSSYRDMVAVVTHMVRTGRSMRCYLKGMNSSPLSQFSSVSENENDPGDGGGIPVYASLSITSFEELAEELAQMFRLELSLKRLLVMEMLSLGCEEFPHAHGFHWSKELYVGEFNDLALCNLYLKESCELVFPSLKGHRTDAPIVQSDHHPSHDVLQVYLTTWLAEVYIDKHRMDEILSAIGEEMHVVLS